MIRKRHFHEALIDCGMLTSLAEVCHTVSMRATLHPRIVCVRRQMAAAPTSHASGRTPCPLPVHTSAHTPLHILDDKRACSPL